MPYRYVMYIVLREARPASREDSLHDAQSFRENYVHQKCHISEFTIEFMDSIQLCELVPYYSKKWWLIYTSKPLLLQNSWQSKHRISSKAQGQHVPSRETGAECEGGRGAKLPCAKTFLLPTTSTARYLHKLSYVSFKLERGEAELR